jgi:hypothetical protein
MPFLSFCPTISTPHTLQKYRARSVSSDFFGGAGGGFCAAVLRLYFVLSEFQ